MSEMRCAVTDLPRGSELDRAVEGVVSNRDGESSVLYIRIDRIEYINRHYGRHGGNETLRRVAGILRRTNDAPLYRAEGPVFAMVITGDSASALEIAGRLRRAVAETTELLEHVTASIAVVSGAEADSAEKLNGIAAERMLIARRRGGDSVCAQSRSDPDEETASGTVLVIDPEAHSLAVLIREIEARGFAVVTASDGEEALEMLFQIVPDVVISELTVPHFSGFELRERMRQAESLALVPFILLSHRRNDDLIRQASSLRILHYHQKPVPVVLIAELVRNLAVPQFREREAGCI